MVVYHALRVAAERCAGPACDAYIPFSLALPLVAIALVAVTGVLGSAGSRGAWRAGIAVTALLGVLGPPAALATWRDAPDILVPVATALILACPVAVLAFAVFGPRRDPLPPGAREAER